MEIGSDFIKSDSKTLTGFSGETASSIGTIKLAVQAGGRTRLVKFVVMDQPSPFNAILGTPWLYSMQAAVSTYHQCVKFPTDRGTWTIRGDQRIARTCFLTEHRMRTLQVSEDIAKPQLAYHSKPELDKVEQVNIHADFPNRTTGIGRELAADIKDQLISLLKKNVSTFAWTMDDMKGIDPAITCHELNVDPTYKPIKQKRRKLGIERSQAVNDEVEKLLNAGSIAEVKYPEWLANPVVVKKKNGKWRVCVDFTDLNKACPKDSFPLPHIDRLVEATAGNELLSFMDAFSGYNQIMMNPSDREKTAFITDRGTYCYKVMPFGLKNAGATYQRLVNRMFADELGRSMEVYIDDMLVKSDEASKHVQHLTKCFNTLNLYGMKLNPAKCTFGVTSGEFLGYIVTKRGIEANPKQITAILNLPAPRTKKEVQNLTGRIAALNRFISRSTDKSLPFYQILKGNKNFEWDQRCQDAFDELKTYLTTPPILAKPKDGEILYLYVAVSDVAVSGVLVREDLGEQKPIFYVSKSLNDAETRYPIVEKVALAIISAARKLRPYFQSHTVVVLTNQPLRTILHSPTQSGRLTKWAVELSEYDVEYRTRTCSKSQVLADFVAEIPPQVGSDDATPATWNLYVDGSRRKEGTGLGVRLELPTGEVLEQAFRLQFDASNNEAEYEALLAGLRLAKNLGASRIHAFCDSQLVTNQFSGEYAVKNDRMMQYHQIVQEKAREFEMFELTKIPRTENHKADSLANMASTNELELKRTIPMEYITLPSIGTAMTNAIDELVSFEQTGSQQDSPDWRRELKDYISTGKEPDDKWKARRLRVKAARYTVIDDRLYKRSASGILLRCIHGDDVQTVLAELHEGDGGSHSSGRYLALRIKKHGHYWPTMLQDSQEFAKKCEMCQRHGPTNHAPTEPLNASASPYPFMKWGMDVVGPFPVATNKHKFLLVMTDYFTKWVEAESFQSVKAKQVPHPNFNNYYPGITRLMHGR